MKRLLRKPVLISVAVLLVLGLGLLGRLMAGKARVAYGAAEVVQNGHVYCWPVADTAAARTRGLSGLAHVAYPLVYLYRVPQVVSFWMQRTRFPVTVAWLSSADRVTGLWSGRPDSDRSQSSPGVVSTVIEFPPGWPPAHLGSTVRMLGSCPPVGAL